MASKLDDIINQLNPDEIIALSKKIEDVRDDAQQKRRINAFLKIEKILADSDMDAENFKDLEETRILVQDLRNQKYTDGKGNYWSKKGRVPSWVTDIIGEDGDIETLAFDSSHLTPLNNKPIQNIDDDSGVPSEEKDNLYDHNDTDVSNNYSNLDDHADIDDTSTDR